MSAEMVLRSFHHGLYAQSGAMRSQPQEDGTCVLYSYSVPIAVRDAAGHVGIIRVTESPSPSTSRHIGVAMRYLEGLGADIHRIAASDAH